MKSALAVFLLFLLPGLASADTSTRYLAFQIFTRGSTDEQVRNFPPPPEDIYKTVAEIKEKLGATGKNDRRAGFILGPLSLGNTEAEIRSLISSGFDVALKTDMAVGFHIDDQMFWSGDQELNKPENLEWIDWSRTPSTGRRLDWSSHPTKIAPPLCLNAKGVRQAMAARAALIGGEIARGVRRLDAAGKPELFLGVIAGWETGIGTDFDTGEPVGYCALSNLGYSAAYPPEDFYRARADVVRDFIGFWAKGLEKAGVPKGKVYSHIAFVPQAMYNIMPQADPTKAPTMLDSIKAAPPENAFAEGVLPGFSTYPMPGQLEEIAAELKEHGDPPWASSEGAAIDPFVAEQGGEGVGMERYLGNLFNHGARLVNVFGWGVGDAGNGFRRIAEGDEALAAYRKFLSGEPLKETPYAAPNLPSSTLEGKVRRIQAELPGYVGKHGPDKAGPLARALDQSLKKRDFTTAEAAADALLRLLDEKPGGGH